MEPPRWSNRGKNKLTIYQSSHVNFSTIWTDNFQLDRYIFSINQGSGWVNYSAENFTGTQNTSIYSIQISASAGTNVSLRFYAYDSCDNLNETTISYFTVSSSPEAPTQYSAGQTRTAAVGAPPASEKKEGVEYLRID